MDGRLPVTLFFHPSMTEVVYDGSYRPPAGVRMSQAYRSTLHIGFDVRGGLLIRQLHHWAALVFLAAIGAHLLRVFFTGAFRRPREVNWVIGVTLFTLALAEGFAGYSLPDDLLSGTGLRIAQGIMLSIPVAGTYLSMFAFGGEFPGHDMVPRLYSLHILLLPGLLLALVMRLTAPSVVLTPVTTRPMVHRSPPAPGLRTALLSYDSALSLGNATSGAPICNGMTALADPANSSIMTVPWIVNSWLYYCVLNNWSPGRASSARISSARTPPNRKKEKAVAR